MAPVRCVVDTNVVATAEGGNPGAGANCRAASAEALAAVMKQGHLFIDDQEAILTEYLRVVSPGQPEAGGAFVKWTLQNQWNDALVTRVPITPQTGGPTEYRELPAPTLGTTYDRSDQKFLAVAAAHGERPPVLQSFDSKWWGWQASLAACGVTVHFLCPREIAVKFEEKMGGE
ncbi:MAG: hypothetical protein AB7L71_18640 [Vicinamibacterales bacterium]